MIRTQIQLSNELYARAKRVADAREMSFAELARRGIETLLGQYAAPEDVGKTWRPPTVRGLGWKGLSPEQLKEQAQKTWLEEQLEEKSGRHGRH